MRRFAYFLAIAVAVGCTDQPADDIGDDGSLDPLPPPGKEDGQFHSGLATNIDSSRTDVWKVTAQWEDKDPATGVTWDESFGKWISAMEWIPSLDGWSMTVKFTTPWGKTLPSPELECAETMLFLRITFAAWHGLPLQIEAQDEHGQKIYFGHFGVRTQAGRWANAPEYAVAYKDYTGTDYSSKWPTDGNLRKRMLHGGEDSQPEIAEGAVFGAYLDEIHLNKRVGYFTVLALDYLGSANLADTANTYNLQPEAVRPGDMLLERWQKVGIGHTLVVHDVTPIAPDNTTYDVTLISGSMPRRQGVRAAGQQAKSYFTGEYTGGPGMNSDGDAYAKLGGGLKRWRVAKAKNGFWTNTWMDADEAHWINSTDFERIAARPGRFQTLLGDAALDQQKTELIAQIADARHHLSQYPASCSARQQREDAFEKLYGVEYMLEQKDQATVDKEQRKLEDYVFAKLDYEHSKTCCWDSSTSAMYDLIMAEAAADKAAADAAMVCTPPVVFMAQKDDYARWASYAAAQNRAADWKPYTDDEGCAAKMITTDALATDSAPTPYCPAP